MPQIQEEKPDPNKPPKPVERPPLKMLEFLDRIGREFEVNAVFRQTNAKLVTDPAESFSSLSNVQSNKYKLKIQYPDWSLGMSMAAAFGWALLSADRDLKKKMTGDPGPLRVFYHAYIHLYSKEKGDWKEPCLITEFLSDHFIRLLAMEPDVWGDSVVEVHYFQQ